MEHSDSTHIDKSRSVIKSNRIIEAKYRLNVREQKFILYMVSLIKVEDTDFKFHRVKISEFEKVLNLEGKKWGNIYQTVKDIILNLNEKPLMIAKENGKKHQIINWVASAEIESGTGIIEFEFSEKLKPYLLQLKSHFTRYSLDNILQLKSGFSIRMYEILKSHQFQGKVEYELEELKMLLGVDDKYDDYTDFKKRVLKTAHAELKSKSDIYFAFKEKRMNRKIHSIHFTIYENTDLRQRDNKPTETKTASQESENDLLNRLISVGFTKNKAQALLDEGFDLIKNAETRQNVAAQFGQPTEWLEERLAFLSEVLKKGKIANPQGFFLKSLEENYTRAELEQRQKTVAAKQKLDVQTQERKQLEAQIKQVSEALWSGKEAAAFALLESGAVVTIAADQWKTLLGESYDAARAKLDNLKAAPLPTRVRIISKIETEAPQYFAHLANLQRDLEALKARLAAFRQ